MQTDNTQPTDDAAKRAETVAKLDAAAAALDDLPVSYRQAWTPPTPEEIAARKADQRETWTRRAWLIAGFLINRDALPLPNFHESEELQNAINSITLALEYDETGVIEDIEGD